MPQARRLRAGDLEDCMRLKNAAGWNQTEADWMALIGDAGSACFGVEEDGRVVATATAFVHRHSPVAWIGMVLTEPAYRGRGLAKHLLGTCLEWCDAAGIPTVKLDATEMGEGLYRSLGFLPEVVVERWVLEGGAIVGAEADEGMPEGARAELPSSLLVEAVHCEGAWAAGRPGANAWFFGPGVAENEAAGRRVASALIARHADGAVFWDLIPDGAAARVAADLGFRPVRRLLRMYRGSAWPTAADAFALGGFEFG